MINVVFLVPVDVKKLNFSILNDGRFIIYEAMDIRNFIWKMEIIGNRCVRIYIILVLLQTSGNILLELNAVFISHRYQRRLAYEVLENVLCRWVGIRSNIFWNIFSENIQMGLALLV